jgi:hypothetical protein
MTKRTVDLRKLKEDAEAIITAPDEVIEERTPVVSRKLTFDVTYDAPDGNSYTDTLQSVVLDSDGRLTKTRVYHGLTQGMIASSLPESEQLRLEAMARLVAQLNDPPEWVLDWAGQDLEFLSELNSMLVRHENAYFRGNIKKNRSGEEQPRISINCTALEATGLTVS